MAKLLQPCPSFPWAYWAVYGKYIAVKTGECYYLPADVGPAGEVQSVVSAPSLDPL